jgi:hypothetical protein
MQAKETDDLKCPCAKDNGRIQEHTFNFFTATALGHDHTHIKTIQQATVPSGLPQ